MIPSTVGFLDQDFEIETQPRSMNFAEHLRNPLMKLQGQSSVVSMETVLIVRTESPQKVMIMQQYRQGSMT